MMTPWWLRSALLGLFAGFAVTPISAAQTAELPPDPPVVEFSASGLMLAPSDWGKDGLRGIAARECRLCFGVALWNGREPLGGSWAEAEGFYYDQFLIEGRDEEPLRVGDRGR